MLPPTPQLPQVRGLIEKDRYFVLHAPRQAGKTTALDTLESELKAEGDIAAVMFSCEMAKTAGDDYAAAEAILLDSLREADTLSGWPEELLPPAPWPQVAPGSRFNEALSEWCRRSPRRVVLILDEIDALQGASMVNVFRQLRDGHNARHEGHPFPSSVVLCGVRDVPDYKVTSGGNRDWSNPAGPFTIITESLRLGDFTTDQVTELYDQHTQATSQEFTKDAVERVFELTQGHPWLVNALAYEITFRMGVRRAITTAQVDEAKERLIRERPVHLDALMARLYEPRGGTSDPGDHGGNTAGHRRFLRRRLLRSPSGSHPGNRRAGNRQPDLPRGPDAAQAPGTVRTFQRREAGRDQPEDLQAPGPEWWQNVTMSPPRAKYFNTTGPCDPQRHYMLPPAPRLPEARALIEMDRYFVLHAPRQTGKTTTLRTLASELTTEGDIAALMFSCERAKTADDDIGWAESLLLDSLRQAAARSGWPEELLPPDPWPQATPGSRFNEALSEWCRRSPRRVVLFLDEIDALQGASLVSILSQLRDGHNARPEGQPFPTSIVLCGLRDVRDYKVASGGEPGRSNPASPFNIIADSLRLDDFTADQIAELYSQHTQATGQEFTKDALDRVFELTQGQPWLVNALAHEITAKMAVIGTINTARVEDAKERLIRARATHLDSLVARLHDPRVKRVIEPVVAGTFPHIDPTYAGALSYVRDLGLIKQTLPLEVANPIYREIILRVLGDPSEQYVMADPHSFVLPDGRFDLPRLLREFVVFWREHAEVLINQEGYHEAACQIILMAFLHRLVNGGGQLDREYAAGTKRLDVLVRWPYTSPEGERLIQREAMELKVWRTHGDDPTPDGLAQLDRYLDRLTLSTGALVIFDRRPEAPSWKERGAFEQATTPSGRQVTVLRV